MTQLYANATQWFVFVIMPITIGIIGWSISYFYVRSGPVDGEPDRKS